MLKYKSIVFIAVSLLLTVSCGKKEEKITQGKLHFAIDYPELKDQFFIYQILPKSLVVTFKKDKAKAAISKAGIDNIVYINNTSKELDMYFHGDEAVYTHIDKSNGGEYFNENKPLKVKLENKTDTLCGFNIKLAKVTDDATNTTFDVWYTTDIAITDVNWYSKLKGVPGVPLKYEMTQFGVHMVVCLRKFQAVEVEDKEVTFKKIGKNLNYTEFRTTISNLFNSFQ